VVGIFWSSACLSHIFSLLSNEYRTYGQADPDCFDLPFACIDLCLGTTFSKSASESGSSSEDDDSSSDSSSESIVSFDNLRATGTGATSGAFVDFDFDFVLLGPADAMVAVYIWRVMNDPHRPDLAEILDLTESD
jgi:hypothetical protein